MKCYRLVGILDPPLISYLEINKLREMREMQIIINYIYRAIIGIKPILVKRD
ncbi:hypothetical protein HanXRQr2_Chr01g0002621 [Helianthus annuus]|uniref:Uncharacterized protein n=1 Tax=Helianthus annuus TaxID=4232 RepID=A0A9K3JSC2_HELAN|nr:hypothetical protein HanXRQr2_Chr01g0002621 [Helianthus annuus]